ncbi:MAG: phage portal protein [Caulobacteraceae bacterium]|nr:phage portal protein [Caulobacteraceae bacterium]
MLATLTKASSRFMQALIPGTRMAASSAAWPSTAPWADYWYQSMGLPNGAGTIGGDDAYQWVSACFAASRLLSGVGSTMPLNLTQITMSSGQRSSHILSANRLHKMINLTPNGDQTSISFRSMMIEFQVNRGTCFAEIQREAYSRTPVAFWPIHPSRCRPFRSEVDGALWWHVRNNDGTDTDIPDVDMLRVPYIVMSRDGIRGIGVADRATQAIQLGQSLDRTENDASMSGVPRIVVEAPQKMNQPEQDAFRRMWRELYQQGGEGVALLVGGMAAKPLSWSAVDSAHVPRREFSIEDLARWYDVPLTLLRRAVKESAGNVEQLGLEFQIYSLKFLEMWEQELDIKLLTEQERDSGMAWKLDFKSLLRADHAGRGARASALFPIGGLNSNEVRDDEGLNPYPAGNKYFVQGAFRPIDEPYAAASPQNPSTNPKTGKADPLKVKTGPKKSAMKGGARLMLEDCIRRITRNEAKAAVAASSKQKEWFSWVESYYSKYESIVSGELSAPLAVCALFGVTDTPETMAARMAGESKAALIEVADGPRETFAERVGTLTAGWERDRASMAVQAIAELN